MTTTKRIVGTKAPKSTRQHQYELRVSDYGFGGTMYEVWQMPSRATPQITTAIRLAGLKGRNLAIVEHRLLRRLAQFDINIRGKNRDAKNGYTLTEELALILGLLFRALAPMRSLDNIRAVVEGIEEMEHEEASYWLGMAMHRKHPRRVLAALRLLLALPKQ